MRGRGRPAQLEILRRNVLVSPTKHGFATELWTLRRVRLLIKRLFGVSYSEVHVWRILGALGFSSQKPERRGDRAQCRRGRAVQAQDLAYA